MIAKQRMEEQHVIDLQAIKSQHKKAQVLQKLTELFSGQTTGKFTVTMLKMTLEKKDLQNVLTANDVPFNLHDRKHELANKLVLEVLSQRDDSEVSGYDMPESEEVESDDEEDEFEEPGDIQEVEGDQEEVDEENEQSEVIEDDTAPLVHPLPTCQTLYIPEEDGEDKCTCPTVAEDLVLGLSTKLPKVSIDLLRESCSMDVYQLMEQIVNFGGFAVESGCKNRMLLQLRDIFLEHNGQPGLMNLSEVPFHLDQSILANVAEGLTSAEGGQAQLVPTTPVAGNLANIVEELEQLVLTPVQHNRQNMVAATPQQKNEMQLECCVCLDRKRTVIFIPCGHIACCRNCADQLETCTVCRAHIDMKVDVYYA